MEPPLLESLLQPSSKLSIAPPSAAGAALAISLARAAAAIARLDQSLANHPLRPVSIFLPRISWSP